MNKDGNIGAAAEFTATPQAWPSDGEHLAVSADSATNSVSSAPAAPTDAAALEAAAAARIAALGASDRPEPSFNRTAGSVSSSNQAPGSNPGPAQSPVDASQQPMGPTSNPNTTGPAPTPVVRSAKDAINAMYAAGGTSLSSYLASTAPNAAKPRVDTKSAASLHHKSDKHKMESTRPSASALFRMAKSKSERTAPPRPTVNAADPLLESHAVAVTKTPKPAAGRPVSVVSTSLKLAPKKPPIVMAPREPRRISDQVSLNPAKSATNLTRRLASQGLKPAARGAQAAASVAHVQQAAAAALKKSTPHASSPRPKKPASRRGAPFQDVVRPANAPHYPLAEPAPAAEPLTPKPAKKSKLLNKPTRSVKERFRPAPKGFVKTEAEQFKSQSFADYSNPDHPVKAQHLSLPAPSSVDIYADEPKPSPAKVQSAKNAETGLGVVRDYRPHGDSLENHIAEQPVASGHGSRDESAPDNNRYTLGGQSPFLKTVQVEKRPLSDGPVYGRSENGGTLYNAPKAEPRSVKKNVYEKKAPKKVKAKKPKKTPKSDKNVLRQDIPARPTVIIPPSRRGHAPLLLLLLLTVILGATVGALAYLCFFQ